MNLQETLNQTPSKPGETTNMDTSVDGPPARIMIVDDHPNTASMLARVLAKFDTPVEILTAQSAEEALEMIGNSIVDVLITDFMMAGMNGLDLIEKLKGEQEPAHTILITAYDTPGLKLSAQRLKINDYLVKPVQPEKIREIVSRVLEEIRPQSQAGVLGKSSGDLTFQKPSRILVADDNPDNIRLLTVRLKSEGYEYITALDGGETLDKIRTEYPDLVLLDVNMPNKDGFEVLLEMRGDPRISHIPVIVVTAARISAKDVREGLNLGADDYVTKPVDWRELSARIRTKLRVKQAEDTLRARNQELSVLPQLSKDLGEQLDVEELTGTILSRSVNALSADNGCLIVFHPDGSTTQQIQYIFDFSPWTWEELKNRLTGEGLVQQVLNSREPLVVENTGANTNWVSIPNDPTRSAILVPLVGRQDVLGVLLLTHKQVGYFAPEHSEQQVNLIQAIASQAAIAIENAQLYTIERRRVNELVALSQLTHQISQYKHSSELFENLPVLVRQHLGYPAVALWAVENHKLVLKRIAGEENAPRRSLLELAPQQAAESGQAAQFSGPIEERAEERTSESKRPTVSTIAVPILWKDNRENWISSKTGDGGGQVRVYGVLSVISMRTNAFQESDRVLLETLAAQTGVVLERISLFESVEQEQKRMAAVLRAAADAILVISNDNRLQLINPAGERLFTDFRTRVGFPLPSNRGYDDLINAIQRARKSGNLEKSDIQWPDGRTFSSLVAPIEEGGEVAVLHDVSHFMAINQLKNEFLATATHDLKNPIFTVMGYADLIEKVGPLNDMQTDFLKRIRNSANQMQDLVLNLLEMARLEMGTDLKIDDINLTTLLTEVFEEFHPQADAKQHSMTLQLSESPIIVKGDRIRLQQVARNLLGNAIKYTPDGGEVTLSAHLLNGSVRVEFRDTGIGIAEEAIPHLFEKFYRVHTDETKDIEGNGLGLAIVKTIVEQHGGTVQVESQEGHGSCFSFVLTVSRTK